LSAGIKPAPTIEQQAQLAFSPSLQSEKNVAIALAGRKPARGRMAEHFRTTVRTGRGIRVQRKDPQSRRSQQQRAATVNMAYDS